MLLSWIFLTLSFEKFPICLMLTHCEVCSHIVRCTFINFYVHPDEKFCVCTSPVSLFTVTLWLSPILPESYLCVRERRWKCLLYHHTKAEKHGIFGHSWNTGRAYKEKSTAKLLVFTGMPWLSSALLFYSISYLLDWWWNLIDLIKDISPVKTGDSYLLQGVNS